MTGWSLLVYWFLPPPLALLIILTIPLPKALRMAILTTTKKLIFFPLAGALKAVHVMLIIAACAFIDQFYRTAELRSRERPALHVDVQLLKGLIWRAERNLWLSLFCFFVWWMLFAYYRLLIRFFTLKDQLDDLKKASNPQEQGPTRQGDKKND